MAEPSPAPAEAPGSVVQPPQAAGATPAPLTPEQRTQSLAEAYRRGILPPDKRSAFEQAVTRGILPGLTPEIRKLVPTGKGPPEGLDTAATRISGKVSPVIPPVEAYKKKAADAFAHLRHLEPDIDYDTGASFASQLGLQKADNPEEAKLVLEEMYGKGNAGQDGAGRWWVKINGKKTAVFGGGQGLKTAVERGGTGILATTPETAGAIVGGAAGSLGGPFDVATIPAGAAAGAAVGKGVDEVAKAVAGRWAKTFGQEAETIGTEAIINGALEGGGQMVSAFKSGVGPWLRSHVFGTTPQAAQMTREMLAAGVKPPLRSAAPNAKVFQYDQLLRNLLAGDPQEAKRVLYVQKQIREVLQNEKIPPDQIDRMMTEINDTDSAVSVAEAGRAAAGVAKGRLTALNKDVDDAMAIAKRSLADSERLLKGVAGTSDANLGMGVAQEIRLARQKVGAAYDVAYGKIDEMVGSQPVIGTDLLKVKAKELSEFIPPDRVPAIIREISAMDPYVTIPQMQRLRSKLLRWEQSPTLTPDIANHEFGELRRAADGAFDSAAIGEPGEPVSEAVKKLRAVNASYKDNIAKFYDQNLNRLVAQTKAGIAPNPSEIAALIVQPEYTARTKMIMGLLTPETRRQVAAADFRSVLDEAAKYTGDSGGKIIRGDALLKALDGRGEMVDMVYGDAFGQPFVKQLRGYAKELAALDGKIDVANLDPSTAATAIKNAIDKTKAMDSFVKERPWNWLSKGEPAQVDRALRMLIQPGNEAQLEQAVKFYGPQSKEWRLIRTYYLKDMLSKAVVEMPSRAKTISGSTIDKAFGKLTPKQQEILFPDGLDGELRRVAKEARFLFPFDVREGGEDMGASLAAAQIKGHVPGSLTADINYVYRKFCGWLSDREFTIRALSAGFDDKQPGAVKLYTRQAMKLLYRQFVNETMAGPGSGSPAQ